MSNITIRRPTGQPSGRLFKLKTQYGLKEIEAMSRELHEYLDVLREHTACPIDEGVMTLMEVSGAYYARAIEMKMRIQELERTGKTPKGSQLYKFRNGELRSFIELCEKSMTLGSRRLTHEQWLTDMRGDYGGAP